MKKGIYIAIGIVLGLAVIGSYLDEEPAASSSAEQPHEVVKSEPELQQVEQKEERETVGEWYEGGTLHGQSALDWQVASYENKLATAGDFVAGAYSSESLNPEVMARINNMSDMRILAEELVRQMDEATKPDDDPELNASIYTNQKVSSLAGMVMVSAGWVGQ